MPNLAPPSLKVRLSSQKAVFATGIYTPIQKLFALKSAVLDPIVSIN
jgi:hypothetical protein